MSQKNVELVQDSFAAWREVDSGLADHRRLEAFIAPDAVWDMSKFSGWPGQSEFRGMDEFLEFRDSWYDGYDEWAYEVENVLDAGQDRVVAVLYQRGKPRGSDSWVEMRYAIIYAIEGGLIQRAEVYASADEALDAAGLSE